MADLKHERMERMERMARSERAVKGAIRNVYEREHGKLNDLHSNLGFAFASGLFAAMTAWAACGFHLHATALLNAFLVGAILGLAAAGFQALIFPWLVESIFERAPDRDTAEMAAKRFAVIECVVWIVAMLTSGIWIARYTLAHGGVPIWMWVIQHRP